MQARNGLGGGTNDITIGGKPRSANGKGVRFVLHAAFIVAVFVHCIDNNAPAASLIRHKLIGSCPCRMEIAPRQSQHGAQP